MTDDTQSGQQGPPANAATERRSFLDLAKWIEQFRSNPTEVLEARDEWYELAIRYVEDPSESQPHADSGFQGLTRILVAWADQQGIDGAGALADLHRQLCAFGRPGPPWGEPPTSEHLQNTMARALVALNRITDGAIIASKHRAKDAAKPMIALDYEGLTILTCLQERAPRLMTISEIAAATCVSDKTVGLRLKTLIDMGLAVRPKGQRHGATITADGRQLLASSPG